MASRHHATSVERDLRDIQLTLNRLVRQMAPSSRRRFDPQAVRSLLAAASYKLDHVQLVLRA
ncbi:hypothetical protein [Paludibacterium purpuratum]|uniref:Uncharacterized protein n=1 Tax=Paludibacterium purpuratum TaxID=1144873 RepID=A0A4R7B516_9NEIS|nr:hypothetical protein [Paludibacterium purpuratum]TDR77865.1 hypothetical protein DFP86_109105 [Paludibacterium purpuratum]